MKNLWFFAVLAFANAAMAQEPPKALQSPQQVSNSAPPKPDISPHMVQMITVEEGLQLEVLDWGGDGKPLVFLAGRGNTAHDFDNFAPRFIVGHHVYAITRRGFGDSSKPIPDGTNYSAERLGKDVVAVITALKIDRPVVVGHSLAGEELSFIGTRFPDKVAGLVYLDAAYAYAYYAPGNFDPPGANVNMVLGELRRKVQQLGPLFRKPQKAVATIDTLLKTDLPQLRSELRAMQKVLRAMPSAPPTPAPPPGAQAPAMRITSAIMEGVEKFGSVKVPALVFFVSPHAPPANTPSAAMLDYFKAVEKNADSAGQIERYRTGNPAARVVVIANAQHSVFKSNPDDTAREMDAFLTNLN